MTTPTLPSKRSASFNRLFALLPKQVQDDANAAYKRFKANPDHPGLSFKHIVGPYYSVRIGLGYRAMAVRRNGYWLWFWIGAHADYDKVLDQLRRGRQNP